MADELIWYSWSDWSTVIVPVKVEKFTDKTVTLAPHGTWHSKPERHNRIASTSYFPTFAEAKAAVIAKLEHEVELRKSQLQYSRSALGQAQSLKEPEVKR